MTLRTWSNDLCFHHDMIMSGSLDLNTLDQVTNEDPLAGLDPTKPLFVHPATGNDLRISLWDTQDLPHIHNVPGQGTSASAAATATSGLYFASALDASSDGSDKSSSSQGSKRIGRRVTSQRSQGTARKTFYEQVRLPRHQEDVAKPGKQIRQGQGGGWRR